MLDSEKANFKAAAERALGHSLEQGKVEALAEIEEVWRNAQKKLNDDNRTGSVTSKEYIERDAKAWEVFEKNGRHVLGDEDFETIFKPFAKTRQAARAVP